MPILQPIVDLVELCAQQGIENAVLCPGSRSAAISIAFARNPKIQCYSISDERSAGFIALGMALKTKKPIVIVCTSGSAVYNFAPAVVEAFFQEIPLIVITADRPVEWIHQNDGQTIYQQNIFGENIKKSYQLIADIESKDAAWFYQRTVNEAINICQIAPAGSVHINIPIREPFYPNENEFLKPSDHIQKIEFQNTKLKLEESLVSRLTNEIINYKSILIGVGQLPYNEEVNSIIERLSSQLNIPVIADIISNISMNHISNHDLFLQEKNSHFKPDLLITIGQSFISKAFKKYFQAHKATAHWHIQDGSHIKDPLQSITKIINCEPSHFLNNLLQIAKNQGIKASQLDYYNNFKGKNDQAQKIKELSIKNGTRFSEIQAYSMCLSYLPKFCDLHLANSMAVRYANMLQFDFNKNIEVFANRGTSGIDGCLSTAVGAALATEKLVFLLIGDMAFMYDRNALWNNYLPHNLRIIVFNNAGGGIFRMIDGPNKQPELEEFFETKQKFSAKSTIIEAGIQYFSAQTKNELEAILPQFINNEKSAKCIEIFTEGKVNQAEFEAFKNAFKLL